MVVKRIAALAMVLFTGACARFPSVPTAYSALPPLAASGPETASVIPPAVPAPAPVELAVAPPAVIIPGTLTAPIAEAGAQAVNPTAVLETSMRTRMAWERLRPADLLKPPAMAARSLERSAEGDVAGSDIGTAPPPVRSPVITRPSDREAAMDRILKGSGRIASTVCSGC